MLLHALSQSTQRLGSLPPSNLKILALSRPSLRRSTLQPSCQWRNLATKSKGPLPHKSRVVAYGTPAGKLAASSGPVLLYQATNTLPFTLGCYSIGIFLVAATYINNATKRAAAEANVASWVKVGTAFGQAGMLIYGGYMLMKVIFLTETSHELLLIM